LAIRGRYFDDAVAALIDGRIAVAVAGHVLNLQQNLNCPGAGTAGCVWDGAVLLSRFLERHASEWVRNRSVLELGSGIGLAGIAAGVLGARRVVLTDLGENLELLERNVRNSQAQWKAGGCQEMLCRECDWTRPPERLTSDDGFDVILVADCVWMEHLVDPLLATVGTFVEWAPKSCDVRVLFSYQRRGRSTDDRFWAGLRQRFAAVDILDEDLCQPDVLKLISCRGAR
jgi:predicted nicotinamide N-methyase